MNDFKLKKIRSRGPLAEQVYVQLKKAIIQGSLASGLRLHEEQLTRAMDISRTPLREAFNRLKAEGLVDIIPRKGVYVFQLTVDDINSLFEAREAIEITFFKRAVKKIPTARINKFRHRLEKAESALKDTIDNPEQWNKNREIYNAADREFHDTLISYAGNKYWEQLYYNIHDRIILYGNRLSNDPYWFPVIIQDHFDIIDAILNHDFETAKSNMSRHIQNVYKCIVQAIE